ncbi:peroxisome assembly factor 2 isoform X2 [Gouania willdenowi]|uniref:Peroxisomal ATPase PEX6 n=1 Tax=Gouania willdenowi TaxID=441366 RepID=A0A8C5CZU4_GOUWI|nr:peroxisome biogenesis factor 6 isoform X2 [Gouania willdenowi]
MAAVEVRLVCLSSFPPHLHPMEVLVCPSQWTVVFHRDSDPPTVLLSLRPPQGLLVRVHTGTEPQVSDSSSGAPVQLFISRLFLQQLGVEDHSTATVRAVEPVKLHRVVLGTGSRWSLQRAVEDTFSRRLMELCSPGHWLLAREGEPLLGLEGLDQDQERPPLMVLECSPVTQGRVTADTTVVLTPYWDSGTSPGSFPACFALHRPLQLHVSDFARYADSLEELSPSLFDSRRWLGMGLRDLLLALECRVEVQVVDTQQWAGLRGQDGGGVDVDSCLFVSKHLLLRLGLFNHEWVRVWRGGGGAERPLSVTVVDLHGNVGFISPTLWFNLTNGDVTPEGNTTLRMKKYRSGSGDSSCSRSVCDATCPPHAQELRLQPVTCPLYQISSCDNLLEQHFNTPRLLSTGDIITVPAKNHPDLLENSMEGSYRSLVLFFRVSKVCSSADGEEEHFYVADKTHTSLFMATPTVCSVPCCSIHRASVSTSPAAGLTTTVDVLTNIIQPHVDHRGSSPLAACTVFLHGPTGSGKMTVVREISSRLNLHLIQVDCVSVRADSAAASEVKLRGVMDSSSSLQRCILLLRNLQLLFRVRGPSEDDSRVTAALSRLLSTAPCSVVVIATTSRARDLSSAVMSAFVHQVEMESPSEEQRLNMLINLSNELHLSRTSNLSNLAHLTAGLVLGDLKALLVGGGRAACERLTNTCDDQHLEEENMCSTGVNIQYQDLMSSLEVLQQTQSRAIGAPEIPKVHWEDVGGLQDVKKEILDTVRLPVQCAKLLPLGLKRTGILLYGPPGTGKTLLAKTVATECSMTFLSVKGPELINMYVGQSEANIREVFIRARAAAPCIVFFDELDSLAPSRGRSGDSGGVIDRVVSQLLAELDTLQSFSGVFVIGATNRPDLLDQSLLRPGRFDKLVYVGINEDRCSQLQVFSAILRKFHLDPSVKLEDLVHQCPAHMTGADMYALCSDAMTTAIKRKISMITEGVDQEDSPLLLSVEDFTSALETFRPSVSEEELLRYRDLQIRLSVT